MAISEQCMRASLSRGRDMSSDAQAGGIVVRKTERGDEPNDIICVRTVTNYDERGQPAERKDNKNEKKHVSMHVVGAVHVWFYVAVGY